ncbi:hypothetical protein [Mucilaginibacter polytrichastri]|nr:hypothetical protein [Mucilaginibacter polytrichastri]SFS39464.1 hypothetical protein SAMN04487890_101246 [Mucilaginibacter polytrichastri]
MKTKIFVLLFCFSSFFVSQSMTIEKHSMARLFSIGVNYYNATSYTCTIQLSGPTSHTITVAPGTTGSFGPITPGQYTVGIYTTGPGTYNYHLDGGGNSPTFINNDNGHGALYSINAQDNLTVGITN